MALGHLQDFYKFDWVSFFEGKKAEVTGITPLFKYEKGEDGKSRVTDQVIGTKIIATIIEDNTKYNPPKTAKDTFVNNKYKPITFKILVANYSGVKVGDIIGKGGYIPIPETVTPYGQNGFINDLSITLQEFRNPKVDK